ncbi:hypothetical protein K1719_031806 [Acacia pycnantha]|nr:hypothetical protein K1719_031806 [Acacia pycnantha]
MQSQPPVLFQAPKVGKALFDGQLLDVHFTRSFYKHILGVIVTYHDIEAIDPGYFKNLKWMLEMISVMFWISLLVLMQMKRNSYYMNRQKELISIFNDKELELLISGLPDIDLDDLRANTEYSDTLLHHLLSNGFGRLFIVSAKKTRHNCCNL